jgi:xylulokinase
VGHATRLRTPPGPSRVAERRPGVIPAIVGLDLGTSEVKAALVGLDGRLLGIERAGYPTDTGADGRAEQDPRHWFAAIASAVRALGHAPRGAGHEPGRIEVQAICCVGQGPTLTVLDEAIAPARPAVTWQDRRPGAGGYGLLPRMAWLAGADPGSLARARWLLASWDAVGLWLSGEAVTTVQAHETVPSPDELETAGVPGSVVPPALPFGTRLGSLRAEAAEALGLSTGIPVVAGVNDGAASMLGAGLREPGDAVDTGGTSGGLAIYADGPVQVGRSFLSPAPLRGRWVVGGAMAALGATVDWIRTSMLGGRWTPDELFEAAARAPAGADGLVILPYLAGERAPIFDDGARGALFGLTLAHGPEHIARAAIEASAYALRHVSEPLAEAGAPVRELRLAGRRTPGDLWARIKGSVLGVPAAIPEVGETAVLGAAILGAVGVGTFATLEEGVVAMTAVARTVEPDPAAKAAYDEAYTIYRALYPALSNLARP